eukprot:805131-Pyramimonas_sp.AAC.1
MAQHPIILITPEIYHRFYRARSCPSIGPKTVQSCITEERLATNPRPSARASSYLVPTMYI